MPRNIKNEIIVIWLLRIGLAIVFFYAALAALQHPLEWDGFFPAFMRNAIAGVTLVKIFAVVELALAAWLLVGTYVRYAGLVCAALFVGIVIFNTSQLIITFRDIGLAFMSLALFFAEK